MRKPAVRVAGGVGSLLLYLFLQVLAASPCLHEALHDDAHHAEHQCAVQAVVHGHVDVPSASPVILYAQELAGFRLQAEAASPALGDLKLPSGRAPPSFLS